MTPEESKIIQTATSQLRQSSQLRTGAIRLLEDLLDRTIVVAAGNAANRTFTVEQQSGNPGNQSYNVENRTLTAGPGQGRSRTYQVENPVYGPDRTFTVEQPWDATFTAEQAWDATFTAEQAWDATFTAEQPWDATFSVQQSCGSEPSSIAGSPQRVKVPGPFSSTPNRGARDPKFDLSSGSSPQSPYVYSDGRNYSPSPARTSPFGQITRASAAVPFGKQANNSTLCSPPRPNNFGSPYSSPGTLYPNSNSSGSTGKYSPSISNPGRSSGRPDSSTLTSQNGTVSGNGNFADLNSSLVSSSGVSRASSDSVVVCPHCRRALNMGVDVRAPVNDSSDQNIRVRIHFDDNSVASGRAGSPTSNPLAVHCPNCGENIHLRLNVQYVETSNETNDREFNVQIDLLPSPLPNASSSSSNSASSGPFRFSTYNCGDCIQAGPKPGDKC